MSSMKAPQEPERLQPWIEQLCRSQLDADSIETAQRKLLDRLTHLATKPRAARRRLHRFALALPLMLALAGSVYLAIGIFYTPYAPAFAAVQHHFNQFRTLTSRMDVRFWQQTTSMQIISYFDGDRRARSDMPGVSMIVDLDKQAMLLLDHVSKTGQWLDGDESAGTEQLEWLEFLRTFQGKAQPIEESRVIDSRSAVGFRLTYQVYDFVLWADRDTDRPLLLEGAIGVDPSNPSQVFSMDFVFDEPLDESMFELTLPHGYRWVEFGVNPGDTRDSN